MGEVVTVPAADLYRMQVQAEWNGWIGQWILGLLIWMAFFQFIQLVMKLVIRAELRTLLDTCISYLQATKIYTELTQASVKNTAAEARQTHAAVQEAVQEAVQQVKDVAHTAANATPTETVWDGSTERRKGDSGRLRTS